MADAVEKKRENEKKIVAQMISFFCRRKHHKRSRSITDHGELLCSDCHHLSLYAQEKSDRCPFMAEKTFCANCSIHCYETNMREKIREVMRYAGPRMIFYRPCEAIKHVLSSFIEKRRLEKTNR